MPTLRETAPYYPPSGDPHPEEMYSQTVESVVRDNLFSIYLYWRLGDGKGGALIRFIEQELKAAGFICDHPKSKSKAKIPHALRLAVHRRDGFVCAICGTDEHLSLDHVIPESRGGPTTLENLRVLCRPCNSRKGAA